MIELPRLAVTLLTVWLLCAASFWANTVAQDVFDLPVVPEPATPPQSNVAEKIRAALQDQDPPPPSGDPILDDVLQIIQQRGSVLDGSSLDSNIDDAAPDQAVPPSDDPAPSAVKFRTAEQLLKAARMLEKIEPHDPARRDLVEKLRRETVRLLSK